MVRLGLGSGNILTLSDENPHEFLRIHRTEVEGLLRERMTETENLLNRNREALKAIAEALVVQKLLFEADIRAIVEQWEANHV
jgi:ATP-dependent Zn protease